MLYFLKIFLFITISLWSLSCCQRRILWRIVWQILWRIIRIILLNFHYFSYFCVYHVEDFKARRVTPPYTGGRGPWKKLWDFENFLLAQNKNLRRGGGTPINFWKMHGSGRKYHHSTRNRKANNFVVTDNSWKCLWKKLWQFL